MDGDQGPVVSVPYATREETEDARAGSASRDPMAPNTGKIPISLSFDTPSITVVLGLPGQRVGCLQLPRILGAGHLATRIAEMSGVPVNAQGWTIGTTPLRNLTTVGALSLSYPHVVAVTLSVVRKEWTISVIM